MSLRKVAYAFLTLAFFSAISLSCNFWLERGSTLSMLSRDGYNGSSRGKSVYVLRRDVRLKWGAWTIPESLEKNLTFQIRFPRIFRAGERLFKIVAEDKDLVFSTTTIKPLQKDL
ncbi:MAG: hypothetical protein ACOCZX_04375 [Candidatus Bipolaricaulota bacterium]